eukprot:694592-Amphidinium_carterae.2
MENFLAVCSLLGLGACKLHCCVEYSESRNNPDPKRATQHSRLVWVVKTGQPRASCAWKAKHSAFKVKHGLSAESWTTSNESRCRGLPNNGRERDLVDIAVAHATKTSSAAADGTPFRDVDLLIDVSQSVDRTPWTLLGSQRVGTLTTSSSLFWTGGGRMLLAEEHFRLQGWDTVRRVNVSDTALKDLSGESMPLPPMAVVLLSVMYHLPMHWEKEPA